MKINNFKRIDKGSIIARFDLEFDGLGLTIREYLYMRAQNGSSWVSSPCRTYSDQEGKKKYYSYIIISDEKKEAFQRKCIELLTPFLEQEQPPQAYLQEECPF